jgi:uncharacterized protein YjbI with pentapeptide repeats
MADDADLSRDEYSYESRLRISAGDVMSDETNLSKEQQITLLFSSVDQPNQGPHEPKWGDSIGVERQAELQGYLDRWQAETDHGLRIGPFHGVRLTGADVSWLAERSGWDMNGWVPLHLEAVDLRGAHLERASLMEAHMEGVFLTLAHLERASLAWAQLEGASLLEARLEDASLAGAQLEGASLRGARLAGTDLRKAHLAGADLTGTGFDKNSRLNEAVLTGASFDQISFDRTNLTVVDWSLVTTLGDERTARAHKDADGKLKTSGIRLAENRAAVRANRVLAVNLQEQGLAEDAARCAYQAQVLQRRVLRSQRKLGAYLLSLARWLGRLRLSPLAHSVRLRPRGAALRVRLLPRWRLGRTYARTGNAPPASAGARRAPSEPQRDPRPRLLHPARSRHAAILAGNPGIHRGHRDRGHIRGNGHPALLWALIASPRYLPASGTTRMGATNLEHVREESGVQTNRVGAKPRAGSNRGADLFLRTSE